MGKNFSQIGRLECCSVKNGNPTSTRNMSNSVNPIRVYHPGLVILNDSYSYVLCCFLPHEFL